MKFYYTATKSDGAKISASIDATSLNEATRMLLKQGLYIKKITKSRWPALKNLPLFLGGVGLVDKILFTKHIATMLKSGITLVEALRVIEEQSASGTFKKILANLIERVKEGQDYLRP